MEETSLRPLDIKKDEREWYIRGEEQHLGPFYPLEVFEMWGTGEDLPVVWREGLTDWMPYEQFCSLIHPLIKNELPPPIPSKLFVKEEVLEELPPPLPPVELLRSAKEALAHTQTLLINTKQKLGKWTYVLLALATLILAGTFTQEIWKSSDIYFPPKPEELNIRDYGRLKRASMVNPSQSVSIAYAFSEDGSKLWMSSNFDKDGVMSIELRSTKGKVLSDKPIIVTAEGLYKDKLVEFNQFNLIKGLNREPGYYKVRIRNVRSLAKSDTQNLDAFFLQELNHEGALYWGKNNIDKVAFQVKLKRFNSYLNNKGRLHLQEMIQNYSTLITLLNQAEYLFIHTFMKIRYGKSIKIFEQNYHAQVGGLLTPMIISIDKIATELKYDKSGLAKNYVEFKNHGIEFGQIVAAMVEETRARRRLGPKYKKKKINFYKNRLKKLRTKISLKKKELQGQLRGLQFSTL